MFYTVLMVDRVTQSCTRHVLNSFIYPTNTALDLISQHIAHLNNKFSLHESRNCSCEFCPIDIMLENDRKVKVVSKYLSKIFIKNESPLSLRCIGNRNGTVKS